MTVKSVEIIVKGRVQGVFFRVSTKQRADALGLTGMVRNVADGSVMIEAQGDADSVQALIDWCHKGPELARVDQVIHREVELFPAESFQIVR